MFDIYTSLKQVSVVVSLAIHVTSIARYYLPWFVDSTPNTQALSLPQITQTHSGASMLACARVHRLKQFHDLRIMSDLELNIF